MSGPLGVGIGGGGSGGAPTSYPYLGFGADGTLSAEVDVRTLQLANEIKGFPAPVPPDADLVTLNLWWDDLSTPTTKCTFVDVAGEAGITETWEHALKCTGDSSGDGFYQRSTYADEPRLKSGRTVSAIAAIWCPAGRVVTMALTTSTPTSVTANTATTGAWETVVVEGLALDGTYVDLKFSIDGAGTFYVVPLGMNIGARAVPLEPRGEEWVEKHVNAIITGDPGGAGYTDTDITANTDPLAKAVQLTGLYNNTSSATQWLRVRRNGATADDHSCDLVTNGVVTAGVYGTASKRVELDDQQIFESKTTAVAGNAEDVIVGIAGYWRWK